ncbi:hypothetical protein BHS06_01050 [Myxococcus xanthus]|uniref:hypothetical protein n=1 Tax=Myxococcus xanthus TaxID=34 RepID=UPI0011263E93|nr:hypothetical protein [Myxococcus xanthus]QDE87642.1 hypothetical protein BHS06_01050 [Myxococcus xanthus]
MGRGLAAGIGKFFLDGSPDAFRFHLRQGGHAFAFFSAHASEEGRLGVEELSPVYMAERQGLTTEPDCLHIPSLARKGRPPAVDVRSWGRRSNLGLRRW